MALASKKPGKLGLALVKNLVEYRPDEKFAIEMAWQSASGRLWKKWADPRLWLSTFDEVPANAKLLEELKRSIVVLYDHPADTSLARVMRQLLQDQRTFSMVTILKAVREYTETLLEELFLADVHFRENLRRCSDPLSREIVQRTTPLLPAEPPATPEKEAVEPPSTGPTVLPEEETRSSLVPPSRLTREETTAGQEPLEELEGMPGIDATAEKALVSSYFQEVEATLEGLRTEPAAPLEPPLQPEAAPAETKAEEAGREKIPPVKPKAYEAWIASDPTNTEIIRIQQLSEEMHPQGEPVPPDVHVEGAATGEFPPVDPWAAPQPIPPESVEDEVVPDELALLRLGLEAELTPPALETSSETQTQAGPALPKKKSAGLAEDRVTSAEMEVRAELEAATREAADLRAKRKKPVLKSIARLFSRPRKTSTAPSLGEATGIEAAPVAFEATPAEFLETEAGPAPVELPEIQVEPEEIPVPPVLPEAVPAEIIPAALGLQPEDLPAPEEIAFQAETLQNNVYLETTAESELPPAEIKAEAETIDGLQQRLQDLQAEIPPVTLESVGEELLPEGTPQLALEAEAEAPVPALELQGELQVEAEPEVASAQAKNIAPERKNPFLKLIARLFSRRKRAPISPVETIELQPEALPADEGMQVQAEAVQGNIRVEEATESELPPAEVLAEPEAIQLIPQPLEAPSAETPPVLVEPVGEALPVVEMPLPELEPDAVEAPPPLQLHEEMQVEAGPAAKRRNPILQAIARLFSRPEKTPTVQLPGMEVQPEEPSAREEMHFQTEVKAEAEEIPLIPPPLEDLRAETPPVSLEPVEAEFASAEMPLLQLEPEAEESVPALELEGETPVETSPTPPPERAEELSEGLLTPVEIQIEAELEPAAVQAKSPTAKRRSPILEAIVRLFSRPQKTPATPLPAIELTPEILSARDETYFPAEVRAGAEEIQVLPEPLEDLHAETPPVPLEPVQEELAASEMALLELEPEAVETQPVLQLQEETQLEAKPALSEEKAEELTEGLTTPAEMQIGAELESAAGQAKSTAAQRKNPILEAIVRLFSRLKKTAAAALPVEAAQVQEAPVAFDARPPQALENEPLPEPIDLPESQIEPEETRVQAASTPDLQTEPLPEPVELPGLTVEPEEIPAAPMLSDVPHSEAAAASIESKPEELPEALITPAEIQIRAEIEAAREEANILAKGRNPILQAFVRFFSRLQKTPAFPPPAKETQVQETPVAFEAAPAQSFQSEPLPVPVELPGIKVELAAVEPATPPKKGRKSASRKKGRLPADARFAGRASEVVQLHQWLNKGKRLVVIGQAAGSNGMAGIGKSCLAREYAERYGQEYRGGVFWFNCTDPEQLSHKIAAWAAGSAARPYKVRLDQVLSDWQQKTARLLIFDQCDDPAVLAEWFPTQGGCRVLVTTRQSRWDLGETGEFLPLDRFTRTESIAFLRGLCGPADIEAGRLDAIAAELGDLPLALRMAGACLGSSHPALSPDDYLQKLHEIRTHPHKYLPRQKSSPAGFDLQVAPALKSCLDLLDSDNEDDRSALKLLQWTSAWAPGEPIRMDLLRSLAVEKLWSEAALEAAGTRLVSLGLWEETKRGQCWLHPVTAGLVQQFFPGCEPLANFERAILSAAVEANRSGSDESMLVLYPHLKHLADHALAARKDENTSRLANELGYYLEKVSDYEGARYYFGKALDINIKVLGQAHAETAICLNNLGHLLTKTGELKTARLYYEQALSNRRKLLGDNHPDTARSLNNLGYVLQALGNHKEALTSYGAALSIRRKTLGEKRPETAVTLNNLGSLYEAMGDHSSARSYFEQALLVRKEIFGTEHPVTAASMNDLGCLFITTGEYGKAKSYLEQALRIRKQSLGEEHPETARSLSNLGELMAAREDYPGAQAYFEQALSIRKKMLGEADLETAATFGNLGSVFQAMGIPSKAESAFQAALAIRMQVQGPQHADVAACLEQLGRISQARNDQAAVQTYSRQVSTIRKGLEKEKRPRFGHLSRRGRTAVASLFVLAFGIFGLNILLPGPAPITLNWKLLNPGEISLLQPLLLFARHTPTSTATATLTLTSTSTPTFTATASSTSTSTRRFVPLLPTATFTAKPVDPTATRTLIYWTFTFTPPPPPPPPDIPTNTPVPTETPTPMPSNTPTLHIVLPPTDTPTLHIVIPPTDTPVPTQVPTDTPVPPVPAGP